MAMYFILRNARAAGAGPSGSQPPSLETFSAQAALAAAPLCADDIPIGRAADLLAVYANTDSNAPLYSQLQLIRSRYIEDLDSVQSVAEINGLLIWLLVDKGINGIGESLEQTADRLSDLDIESDTDRYTAIVSRLKDAVDRLYELELDAPD